MKILQVTNHILDVRNDNEWNNGHLSQAVHVPHGKLLDTDLPFSKMMLFMYTVNLALEVL